LPLTRRSDDQDWSRAASRADLVADEHSGEVIDLIGRYDGEILGSGLLARDHYRDHIWRWASVFELLTCALLIQINEIPT